MKQRLELLAGQLLRWNLARSVPMTYMSVWNPGRALASLQPLDELGPVTNRLWGRLLWRNRSRGTVEDGPFTQVGPDALL